jgi:hypothetical protein
MLFIFLSFGGKGSKPVNLSVMGLFHLVNFRLILLCNLSLDLLKELIVNLFLL